MLAKILGVTRPSLTQAAGLLQEKGLIRYSRGKVDIIDRAGLECHACECYDAVKAYIRDTSLKPQDHCDRLPSFLAIQAR